MKQVSSSEVLVDLKASVRDYLVRLYPEHDVDALTEDVIQIMGFDQGLVAVESHVNLWDETDIVTITYGDSIKKDGEYPLQTLHNFLRSYLSDTINAVHILPFYPFSSDDGFSVINYSEVNQSLGDWENINDIAKDFKLMADLVINHCSSRSLWFDNFKQRKHPGLDYFIECDPQVDLGDVVRPRTSPLLRKTDTLDGEKHVWCTFSHDQVDLNFRNPDVLLEFIKIIRFYLDRG
ncbi:MAG: alpha-amylase, partial [Gammaproteobacteria bacterium]|nr:alpha-amylase [Gammaproteobacteria bacterium]